MITIGRWSEAAEPARSQFPAMLLDYHRRTALETSLGREPLPGERSDDTELPTNYQREIDTPETAFANATVLLALEDGSALGSVILTPGPSPAVKRLWVTHAARRRGVATKLLDAAASIAAERGDRTLRLSVWWWRTAAITLYERSGFSAAPSWESRPDLRCFVRKLD